MNQWDKVYKIMNEAEEPAETLSPAEEVDSMDDILYKVVYALNTVFNDKDDGKEDEDAKEFLRIVDTLAQRFRSKFPSVVKTSGLLDDREKGKKVTLTRNMLKDLFKTLNKEKNKKEDEPESPS